MTLLPSLPANAELDRLLYRNGFVVSKSPAEAPSLAGWTSVPVGDAYLTLHPETRFVTAAAAGRHLALVGLAFDPERGLYQESDVLAALLDAVANDDDFYAVLDRLAGRFALIVQSDGRTEIYQDAMGSRSVFYSTAGAPIAASHAEIVADLIGARFADFFVPFLTSRNYQQRDVKYLPGVATPYDHVVQLTPNTKLIMPQQKVERFWPRKEMGPETTNEEATAALVAHLHGLRWYLAVNGRRPVLGLTAGTDSRGVFAATKDSSPVIFTYVRSESANLTGSSDARAAAAIAGAYGLEPQVWPIHNRLTLNQTDDALSEAFRRSTGYYRGPGSPWLGRLAQTGAKIKGGLFIRGFGGEVMRGFYQSQEKRITKVNVQQLSNAYDVNAGSHITRSFFEDMMERVSLTTESIMGYDPNDIFYWEHRMGTWGSVSMSEADLAMPSIVGYNSRNLFATFMALPQAIRASRSAFAEATVELAPLLKDVDV
ncbi:hypothetical protein [Arthrobacter sp. C9C5]|uniref:hypothetical protein n=1 Tax=Arthrobacter sp. C9C5 TaxID=2735267 RepID=UPI00158479A7|nr:hypothetical protein [Arthrobacter sp. C9C5]NUU33226.1 hypothetical protein [Arthrobacter sp. C9C5]